MSFEIRGYVESATELVFDNTIHNLKGIDITYKTTLHMISLDIAFNSYRRVNMEFTNAEIRAILKFSFVKGKSARETFREINGVLGDGTLSLRTAEEWFRRFRAGENDTMDKPAGGRPVTTNTDQIMEYIELDRHVASRDIAQEVGVSHQTVLNHLQKAGYKKKLDVCVPHELTQKNMMDRISICESLLNRNKIDPFLKRIVTGDEKWVTYDNKRRKRSWSKHGESSQTVAKPGLTARKALLCVWWDWKGIIHYELLPYGQTLNSTIYCEQLDRLKQAIDQKRPELANRKGVVFHQDNARPHTSLVTRQKLRELGWEVIMHPPYSPDLAPSDYHLFLSMANALGGVKLDSKEACEKWLSEFFANKEGGFYEGGIMKLPSRWEQIIEQNGAYLN